MSAKFLNSESGKLILAAKAGDALSLISALNAGADKDVVDSDCHNYTALHWGALHLACLKRHGHIILLLKTHILGNSPIPSKSVNILLEA